METDEFSMGDLDVLPLELISHILATIPTHLHTVRYNEEVQVRHRLFSSVETVPRAHSLRSVCRMFRILLDRLVRHLSIAGRGETLQFTTIVEKISRCCYLDTLCIVDFSPNSADGREQLVRALNQRPRPIKLLSTPAFTARRVAEIHPVDVPSSVVIMNLHPRPQPREHDMFGSPVHPQSRDPYILRSYDGVLTFSANSLTVVSETRPVLDGSMCESLVQAYVDAYGPLCKVFWPDSVLEHFKIPNFFPQYHRKMVSTGSTGSVSALFLNDLVYAVHIRNAPEAQVACGLALWDTPGLIIVVPIEGALWIRRFARPDALVAVLNI